MKLYELKHQLEENPIIMAIQCDDDFSMLRNNENTVVFIHYGDIMTIPSIVKTVKAMGKYAFVNIDMIDGVSGSKTAVDFFKMIGVDGIISTKPNLLKYAKTRGILTILRTFVIDSKSWRGIDKMMEASRADVINVVPGWGRIIQWTTERFVEPVIASGLICEKDLVMEALNCGAIAICTTNHDVWEM